MRKAITLGLLALALIPFSLDRHSEARNRTADTVDPSLATHEAARDARRLDALASEMTATFERAKIRREAGFTAARNAEIRRSLAAYETARDIRFVEARNREIAASSARSARARTRAFAAARNAEARRSLAAYEGARRELIAEAYQREIALVAARYAEREIAIARANGESIFATLARIAPHIGVSSAIAQRTLRANPIETASIGEPAVIGPCATPSP